MRSMPYSYRIEKARHLVISTATGCVTFTEILDHQDQLLNDRDFNPEFNQLIDGSRTTALKISIREAQRIASRRIFSASSRRAYVSPGPAVPGVGILMAIYQEAGVSLEQTRVFYDISWAYEFIEPQPVV